MPAKISFRVLAEMADPLRSPGLRLHGEGWLPVPDPQTITWSGWYDESSGHASARPVASLNLASVAPGEWPIATTTSIDDRIAGAT